MNPEEKDRYLFIERHNKEVKEESMRREEQMKQLKKMMERDRLDRDN